MNHSILYLECNSGISGDMTVAALLDLGADRQILLDALSSLPLTGYSIEIKDVYKSGIRACDFNVILDHDNHDHDMDYLHGHAHNMTDEHDHTHSHNLSDEHGQIHRHDHSMTVGDVHGHDTDESQHIHHHHHDARNLNDITKIIQTGQLSSGAKDLALKIFQILAEAEAAVHGKTLEEIHFHEVGAVDSIVDIVAVAVCIDNLSPSGIVISALTDGKGQIRCQHGLIPVPVPAVTAIAMQNDLTLNISESKGRVCHTDRCCHSCCRSNCHNTSKRISDPPHRICRKAIAPRPDCCAPCCFNHSQKTPMIRSCLLRRTSTTAAEKRSPIKCSCCSTPVHSMLSASRSMKKPAGLSAQGAVQSGTARGNGVNHFPQYDYHRHPYSGNAAHQTSTENFRTGNAMGHGRCQMLHVRKRYLLLSGK